MDIRPENPIMHRAPNIETDMRYRIKQAVVMVVVTVGIAVVMIAGELAIVGLGIEWVMRK
jgi:hypothetical protein